MHRCYNFFWSNPWHNHSSCKANTLVLYLKNTALHHSYQWQQVFRFWNYTLFQVLSLKKNISECEYFYRQQIGQWTYFLANFLIKRTLYSKGHQPLCNWDLLLGYRLTLRATSFIHTFKIQSLLNLPLIMLPLMMLIYVTILIILMPFSKQARGRPTWSLGPGARGHRVGDSCFIVMDAPSIYGLTAGHTASMKYQRFLVILYLSHANACNT